MQAATAVGPVALIILIGVGASWLGIGFEFALTYLTAGMVIASTALAFTGIIKKGLMNLEASAKIRSESALLGVVTLFYLAFVWVYNQEVILACDAPGALQRCLESQATSAMTFFLLLSISVPVGIIASSISWSRNHSKSPNNGA